MLIFMHTSLISVCMHVLALSPLLLLLCQGVDRYRPCHRCWHCNFALYTSVGPVADVSTVMSICKQALALSQLFLLFC